MIFINKLQLAALFIGLTAYSIAQEVSFTPGGETATKLVKQSKLENFSVAGNSYFVTAYMESATMHYYMESYSDKGVARIETKLEVPVGSFNNSFGIEGVIGFGAHAYALVGNANKSSGKNTLFIREIENSGEVSTTEKELMFLTFEKMMNAGFFNHAVSPNQKTLLIAGELPFVKGQEAKVKLSLFDASLNEMKSTEISIPGEDTKNKRISVKVADDGSVYIIRHSSNKIGEIVLSTYEVNMESGKVKEHTINLEAPNYIFTYETAISENHELIVAGTYYTRATLTTGEKKATGIFFFTNKNKSENLLASFPLDKPVDNLTARKILVNGNTIYLAAEQFKEERIDPPASSAGTSAAFDYQYNLIHKNEYVIGMDTDGKRKFELNIPKDLTARNIDHQYVSAYFISNGKFTMIYNDERKKFSTNTQHASLIPSVVQITNDGLMTPGVPFLDKIKLPVDHILFTAKYVVIADGQINFLLSNNETSKFVSISIK